jgi:protein Tob/BTG
MKQEIEAAALFLFQYIKDQPKAKENKKALSKAIYRKVKGHWETQNPMKGNGYRAINFLPGMALDDVLSGLNIPNIHSLFPEEMVLWVDPGEVSYRVGDYGYGSVLYESEKADSGTEVSFPKKITISAPKAVVSSFKAAPIYAH